MTNHNHLFFCQLWFLLLPAVAFAEASLNTAILEAVDSAVHGQAIVTADEANQQSTNTAPVNDTTSMPESLHDTPAQYIEVDTKTQNDDVHTEDQAEPGSARTEQDSDTTAGNLSKDSDTDAAITSPAAAFEEDVEAGVQYQTEDAAVKAMDEANTDTLEEMTDTGVNEAESDLGEDVTLESYGSTPDGNDETATRTPALETGIRKGERRPEEQFSIDIFDRPLTIGGSYEALLYLQEDTAFDNDDDEYEFISHSLSLEFFYEISDSISFFADGALYYFKDDSIRQTGAQRYQTWLYFEEIFDSNFDIKLGAQYFSDDRTWWWDDDLDAVSIQYWGDVLQAEVALVQELARSSTVEDFIDPAEDDLNRLLTRVGWEVTEDHWLEFFYVLQNDHSETQAIGSIIDSNKLDDTDADLQWLGIRSSGYKDVDNYGDIYYWLDTAYMDGDETFLWTSDVPGDPGKVVVDDVTTSALYGWAFDLGLTWYTEFPLYPSFTIGYAVGSGKLDDEGFLTTAFQQTGLQSNSSYFTDVNYIAYYGELLFPELSNLKIFTLGVSIPLLENTALDVVYHQYDQYVAADYLRFAGIGVDPNGTSKDIGREIDIIFRALEFVHWEYGVSAAFFEAGDAFDSDSGEIAGSLYFDLRYNF